MSAVTPTSTPHRKRTVHDAQLDDDDSETPPLPGALVLQTNGNHLRMMSSYATRKRLRPEQLAEVESFLRDPPAVQMAKIFIDMKATKNALDKFQAAKPQFEINAALKANLTRAVNAILCSSQVTHYKGDSTKSEVQTLLFRHRWGNFVIGTEHDKSSMDTVTKFIADVFTQSRSIMKKEIVKSVEVAASSGKKNSDAKPALRPDDTHTTIYQLTKIIVHKLCGGKNISIPITPALCSRIAVMRKWHVKKVLNTVNVKKTKTLDYWELVDLDLRDIREAARKDTTDAVEIAKRVARAFNSVLEKDRKHHGSNPSEEIPDAAIATDDAGISFQADIDNMLEARSGGQDLPVGQETEGESLGTEGSH
ncbi:hypothetical protein DFH08DRAFT_797983 [Mycena albidolilacea]|uniref:Uncharacterized protein n=1 Tax=Mycena albidolilacea TaxID=1033008 RepID=A0AAD7ASG8_9AGAR|nr:hypothetical protein DFH08DRAFT_797983 [Mycena albidolilacea]